MLAFLRQRLHGSGHLLANAIFGLVDSKDHGLKFMPLSIVFAVEANVESTVFIRHIAGCRGDNAILADVGVLDVRAACKFLFAAILNCGFAKHRLSEWGHIREGVIGQRYVPLFYGCFSTRPRLGVHQYRGNQNEQRNQAVAQSFPPCERSSSFSSEPCIAVRLHGQPGVRAIVARKCSPFINTEPGASAGPYVTDRERSL